MGGDAKVCTRSRMCCFVCVLQLDAAESRLCTDEGGEEEDREREGERERDSSNTVLLSPGLSPTVPEPLLTSSGDLSG